MIVMRLEHVDLNLLVALDALLRERHVTRAATRIGLTQPAMSQALARLRTMLGDPLLVRTPRGMLPTARAEAMRVPLAEALDAVTRAIEKPGAFDPKKTTRRFRIATGDYIELVLLPKLLARLATEAPGADLCVTYHGTTTVGDLEDGKVDLAIVPGVPKTAGFYAQKLIDETFVCVVRRDHPLVKKRLTLDTYIELPHLLVAPRGQAGSFVDTVLARLGKRRRVAVEVPHFLVTPHLLQETDLVVTLAARVARAFETKFDLRIFPAPLDLDGFSMSLVWHERLHGDPAHAWLRGEVAKLSKTI